MSWIYYNLILHSLLKKNSQLNQAPTILHWRSLKRVLYLIVTPTLELILQPANSICLTGYSDVDWDASSDDQKFVSGYCVFLGDTLIFWSSNKQMVVACSSTEP